MKLEEIIAASGGRCPDCGGELTEGPHGGCSVNMLCYGCGSRFNMLDPSLVSKPEDLVGTGFCERIGKMSPQMITQMKKLYPI